LHVFDVLNQSKVTQLGGVAKVAPDKFAKFFEPGEKMRLRLESRSDHKRMQKYGLSGNLALGGCGMKGLSGGLGLPLNLNL
tara:strand:+ start:2330 stop:2572 length:243 start_codon:yes stop_codon:yes gene_type:complete